MPLIMGGKKWLVFHASIVFHPRTISTRSTGGHWWVGLWNGGINLASDLSMVANGQFSPIGGDKTAATRASVLPLDHPGCSSAIDDYHFLLAEWLIIRV